MIFAFNDLFKLTLFFSIATQILLCEESYQEYVREIECTFARKMAKELDLHWAGTAGRMHEKVEELGLKFAARRRATIKEARALELYVIDQFVQAINAHEKIQPYLAVSPFTYKRVSIQITFNDKSNRHYSDGSVCYMLSVSELAHTEWKNHITYDSKDPFRNALVDLLEEPYEEAVKLNAKETIDLSIHQENAYEEEMDLLFDSFTKEMENQYALEPWAIGGDLTDGIKTIGATFKLHQPISFEQARWLLVAVTEKLQKKINNNEKLRPYLDKYPFPLNSISIALHFEKNRFYSYPDDRIASAKLKDSIIQYVKKVFPPLEENEDPSFRLPKTIELEPEPYEEAIKILQDNPVTFKPKSPSILTYVQEWLYRLMYYTYFFVAIE